MESTKKEYCAQSDIVHRIFQNILNEVITSAFSREETELHSFYIQKSYSDKRTECIYFDKQPLSQEEITDKCDNNDQSFIQKYLTQKTGYQNHICRSTKTIHIENSLCRVYLTLSSECLDDQHGTLVLNCLLQQLTNRFGHFKASVNDSQQPLNNKGPADIMILTDRIIQATERDINNYLQIMFKPFQIDWVNILSGEYYEHSECQSNIIFLPHGTQDILEDEDWIYCFEETPFLPQNKRLIRKWLHMARDNIYLVLCADKSGEVFNIHGICNISNLEKKLSFPYLRAEIRKHMLWNLFLNKQYIFTFCNGHYKIGREIQGEYLCKKLTATFGNSEDKYLPLIRSIIQITAQKHGTILIIMKPSDAKCEAARLGNLKYGFQASEPKLQEETIGHLSSIDGSIIIDTEGRVHGIGIILDGLSKETGRPDKGSRYNSVIKYPSALRDVSKNWSEKWLALIISDDGFMDFFPPNILPQN